MQMKHNFAFPYNKIRLNYTDTHTFRSYYFVLSKNTWLNTSMKPMYSYITRKMW